MFQMMEYKCTRWLYVSECTRWLHVSDDGV